MAGSKLMVSNQGSATRHELLTGRDSSGQHPLESIYRRNDGKDLATIIAELTASGREVLYDRVTVETDGQTEVSWLAFQYSVTRDVLFVQLQGTDVYEGTELDFVKTSPHSITFNYPLKKDYEVFVVLAGTISGQSFGDDIFNGLTQFRQLTDTPKAYYGHGGQSVVVNEGETGLVFETIESNKQYIAIEDEITVGTNTFFEKWLPLTHNGSIESIKMTPINGCDGQFSLAIWTDSSKHEWVYYSGLMTGILYDIMRIPHMDTSGQDKVYIRITNNGTQALFKLKIMILQ